VVTLWYRAPEILLGAPHYNESVDVWSSACVLAELLRRKPLICESHEISCIFRIFRLCGSPDAAEMPTLKKMPFFSTNYPKFREDTFENSLPLRGRGPALDLIRGMMRLSASRRLSAREALRHIFLRRQGVGTEFKRPRACLASC